MSLLWSGIIDSRRVISDQEFEYGRQIVLRLDGRKTPDDDPVVVSDEEVLVDLSGPSAADWRRLGNRIEQRWPLHSVQIRGNQIQLSFSRS